LVLAWVTESVIWLSTEVGKAIENFLSGYGAIGQPPLGPKTGS
jgi:hypothetical protein